jgi:NADH-quinone oxidoreductase subunit N
MFDSSTITLIFPWIILGFGIMATMLASSVRIETRLPAKLLTIFTLVLVMITSAKLFNLDTTITINGFIEVSHLSCMTLFFISAISLIFVVGSGGYLEKEKLHISDFYNLVLLMVLGASVLVSAKDLFVMFIALEVMSLPAYALVGFRRNDSRSNEAALKYFILGGALGAVYLLGASFIFGASGSTQLSQIFEWSKIHNGDVLLFLVGHILVLFAFLFKAAAAPFHFWKPDVYEGSPVAVTGLMATVITTAAFVVLVRLFHMVDFQSQTFVPYLESLKQLIRVVAVLSLVVGSTIMILQKNLKRLLAYSAINHTGYILLGLLGTMSKPEQIYSVWFYLAGYAVISCGLFLLLSQSETRNDQGLELVDLTGLMKRNPLVTALASIFFLSMAGMPFTVGFFTKYTVFMSSIASGEVVFVIIAAICTVIGAYGYLRPVALMVMRDPDPTAAEFNGTKSNQALIIMLAVLCLVLGVFPQALIQLTKGMELIP